jgi:signal transduction histidine kinase
VSYAFEPVDAIEVAHEVLDTWRVRLEHQGFVLDFREPENLPPVRADRHALGQAFFNLLDNAVKYSGDSKRIVVRLTQVGDELLFEVTDYGIGISRAEQKHIFDRFHRVGSGLTHDVKGSGLGLSLVHHITAAHDGRVSVESTLGEGSTFTLHLPLAEDEADAELQPSRLESVSRA